MGFREMFWQNIGLTPFVKNPGSGSKFVFSFYQGKKRLVRPDRIYFYQGGTADPNFTVFRTKIKLQIKHKVPTPLDTTLCQVRKVYNILAIHCTLFISM